MASKHPNVKQSKIDELNKEKERLMGRLDEIAAKNRCQACARTLDLANNGFRITQQCNHFLCEQCVAGLFPGRKLKAACPAEVAFEQRCNKKIERRRLLERTSESDFHKAMLDIRQRMGDASFIDDVVRGRTEIVMSENVFTKVRQGPSKRRFFKSARADRQSAGKELYQDKSSAKKRSVKAPKTPSKRKHGAGDARKRLFTGSFREETPDPDAGTSNKSEEGKAVEDEVPPLSFESRAERSKLCSPLYHVGKRKIVADPSPMTVGENEEGVALSNDAETMETREAVKTVTEDAVEIETVENDADDDKPVEPIVAVCQVEIDSGTTAELPASAMPPTANYSQESEIEFVAQVDGAESLGESAPAVAKDAIDTVDNGDLKSAEPIVAQHQVEFESGATTTEPPESVMPPTAEQLFPNAMSPPMSEVKSPEEQCDRFEDKSMVFNDEPQAAAADVVSNSPPTNAPTESEFAITAAGAAMKHPTDSIVAAGFISTPRQSVNPAVLKSNLDFQESPVEIQLPTLPIDAVTPEARSPAPPSARPVITYSGIRDKTKYTYLDEFSKKFGVEVRRGYNPTVTHLVIDCDETERCAARTLKYMQCVAHRKWIVTFDWIRDALVDGQWPEESNYLVYGDTALDAHRKSAAPNMAVSSSSSERPLRGTLVCVLPSVEKASISSDDLIDLAGAMGATMTATTQELLDYELNRSYCTVKVVVSPPKIKLSVDQREELSAAGAFVVNETWLLDSISVYQRKNPAGYLNIED